MEKLIELLNEYWRKKEEIWLDYAKWTWFTDREQTLLCSKYWWFIKWLVDNDKVDIWVVELVEIAQYWKYTGYEALLMSLAISDNPIDFLIWLLK